MLLFTDTSFLECVYIDYYSHCFVLLFWFSWGYFMYIFEWTFLKFILIIFAWFHPGV